MGTQLAELGSLVRHGAPTDQAVKDEAFRLWIEYGRSWKRTSEATGIGESTLHLWAERENWQEKRAAFASVAAQGYLTETAFSRQAAAHYATIRLQQLAYDEAVNGIKADLNTVKAMTLIASLDVNARSIKAGPAEITPPQSTETAELRNLSPDELMLREQQARSRSRRQP